MKMRSKMLAGVFALMVVGCATEGADGLELETANPDLVTGTFTSDGMTIAFELTNDVMLVSTLEQLPVFEADIASGVRVTRAVPEAALLPALYDALGTIECPPRPPRWWEFAGRADESKR
jgi:hypothetical protein